MNSKEKRLALITTLAGLFRQGKECDKELHDMQDMFIEDINEIDKDIKSIVDEKINNDRYNKEQMKFRKRFYKK